MTEKAHEVSADILVTTTALDAPAIFVDSLWSASSLNGVVRLSFVQNLADPPGTPTEGFRGRHIVTLVVPGIQAKIMADFLSKSVQNLISQGLIDVVPSD